MPRKLQWAIVYFFWGFAILLIGSIAIFGKHPDKSVEKIERDSKVMAITLCQEAVKESLTSPGSADFPLSTSVTFSGSIYTISSYVEARNAYNAVVRTPYYCELELIGKDVNETSSWKRGKLSLQ